MSVRVEPAVIAVVGSTATGKSDLALHLARELGGEIVNADASQIYRGMNIGTAKLPFQQRQGIEHHLLDFLDVSDEATVAAYQERATRTIDELLAAGTPVVLVGGSGLYVRAALDVLDIPPTDPQVRLAWEGRLAIEGVDALHRRLATVDPRAAEAIGAFNGRRIVRALEVIQITGRPFSASMPTRTYRHPTLQIGLRAEREVLQPRVVTRAHAMWAGGFLDEVRTLDGLGLRQGRTASRAIGYAQALRQLDGDLSQEEAITETVLLTMRFARRQRAWFRPDQRIQWLDHDDPQLAERASHLVHAVHP
ncbi:tRNA (adenosine(37)-N6)-dimethylallyltransferase MiaA [Dermatophilaceae bacterium Sec6.4]